MSRNSTHPVVGKRNTIRCTGWFLPRWPFLLASLPFYIYQQLFPSRVSVGQTGRFDPAAEYNTPQANPQLPQVVAGQIQRQQDVAMVVEVS